MFKKIKRRGLVHVLTVNAIALYGHIQILKVNDICHKDI